MSEPPRQRVVYARPESLMRGATRMLRQRQVRLVRSTWSAGGSMQVSGVVNARATRLRKWF